MKEQGTLSIHTENIFPIIKKFLYSDHEIFLRELVSNAVDACQKLKSLSSFGEFKGELGDLKVKVTFNEANKTITISDNGIGMTADEIKKYINQIAFSGAAEFVEKYQDKTDSRHIIGHFGLGFYSAFMVSKKVEIITLSYQEGAEAAKWTCEGDTNFDITNTVKKERGTEIILHIAEDSEEFLNKGRLQGILEKYCKFLPVSIEFEGEVINNPTPLWTKQPSEITDEEYLEFYKQLYPFTEDPLFWIHLNVDYPFNLTGILYFPKIKNNLEIQKNKIQLYSRQVFITDEVKDVVPEFLMLLHGVIDSPDIPLNVSRSYLQADANVKKINTYITKKVADKLMELFKENRDGFEKKWDSIGLFVKYGIITDEKFAEKAEKFSLLKNIENKYFTTEEYKEKIGTLQKDKNENLVALYTTDTDKQYTFIEGAQKRGYDVLKMEDILDNHFISALERKLEKTQFKRIDSEVIDKIIDKDRSQETVLTEKEKQEITDLFKKVLNDEQLQVTVEALPPDDLPLSMVMPEFMRRMKEMSEAQGLPFGMLNTQYQFVINGNHPIIQKILKSEAAQQETLIKQTYDIAQLSQDLLKGKSLSEFIGRTLTLLQ